MSELDQVAALSSLCCVQAVDRLPRGHLRVQTSLLYPDGSYVDVFLERADSPSPPRRLTDLGQAVEQLTLMGIEWGPERERQLAGMLEGGISFVDGKLEVQVDTFEEPDHLGDRVLGLAQAVLRIVGQLATA